MVIDSDFSFVTGTPYASGAVLLLIGGVITCVIAAFGVLGGLGKWWALLLIVSAETMQALSMRVTCVLKAKRGTALLCFCVCVCSTQSC